MTLFKTTTAYTFLNSLPMWDYDGAQPYPGDNFIPDTSTTFHVTEVELGLQNDGTIYTVNILGDGVSRPPVPNGGCSSLSLTNHHLLVGASERITKVEAWLDEISLKWYGIKLTMQSGVI